uniref:Uncharacterized protein n=1 Tax=Noctiluca scintillans TaxID=2966 RepID=A0A7S1AKY9_NOCSC|mmetsp:Transcript_50631/g.134848  ORF Transcript_50631/g.134848 Transcript_50631/m.134848 type:complete len:233 (+) Transcript_50631:123-821(+)|eukprot:CAMPEP_0194544104 /NCGR_PEP_ID=MMETSP0253-20130528/86936_1 /TAXON_ID=2966 /ORGANISM="Noctiluca scintillans" /LENGTH=232 /DNA_ID=CAMNT_0039390941 /DNA_START=80 /DNA_END=778 /DNA_ORIENTATION=-
MRALAGQPSNSGPWCGSLRPRAHKGQTSCPADSDDDEDDVDVRNDQLETQSPCFGITQKRFQTANLLRLPRPLQLSLTKSLPGMPGSTPLHTAELLRWSPSPKNPRVAPHSGMFGRLDELRQLVIKNQQEIRDNRLKLTEIQSCFDDVRNLRVDTTPLVLHFSPKQVVRVPPETDVGAKGSDWDRGSRRVPLVAGVSRRQHGDPSWNVGDQVVGLGDVDATKKVLKLPALKA